MKLRLSILLLSATGLLLGTAGDAEAQTPGEFEIRYNFDSLTAEEDAQLRPAFDAVESFYESVILGYQPGVQLDGIDIAVFVEDIDGAGTVEDGNVLAQARPGFQGDNFMPGISQQGTFDSNFFFVTGSDPSSLTGLITIDSFDINTELIVDVIKHETAHALGFVPGLFDLNNLLDEAGDLVGEQGLAAFQQEFDVPDATVVPLDEISAHLEELSGAADLVDAFGRNFSDELLTPIIANGTNAENFELNFFSSTSAGIFNDLGFVAVAPAPFAVPEPSSLAFLALGAAAMVTRRRR